MDIVLGLSMTPAAIRMVLVEGENAGGVTVEEDEFEAATAVDSATEQVVSAILGTREGAGAAGHQLTSIGVTWTDQLEASALRDTLAARKVDNVMLISAFLAAAALAQAVGQAIGYERIAMLFVEPETATLAVVESADGAIADIHTQPLDSADGIAELTGLVATAETLETRPQGLFVIGSGVDIASLKPQLETATSLAVSAPEEPETALARGAALASANATLLAAYTDALAYAQDSGTEEVDPDTVAPGYFDGSGGPAAARPGEENLAYSAVLDEDAEALTAVIDTAEEAGLNESLQQRRPVLLLGSVGAVAVIGAVAALEVALTLGIRDTNVAVQPMPGRNPIAPLQELLLPPDQASAPRVGSIRQQLPLAKLPIVNAPTPAAPAPAPAAPAPAAPAPVPVLFGPIAPVQNPGLRVNGTIPDFPNYPFLLPLPIAPSLPVPRFPARIPVRQPPTTVPVSQPPTTVPVSQPPTTVPVSRPPTTAPVSRPPTTVPVSRPPTTVPVSRPPTAAPVSRPPTHVPAAPVTNVPESQLPVDIPAPEAPSVPGQPGPESPPVGSQPVPEGPPGLGSPGLEAPPVPGSPGLGGAPVPDVPAGIPQLPHSLTPPAQGPPPNLGGGGIGGPVGGGGGGIGGPVGGGGGGIGGPVGGGGGGIGGGSLGGGSLGGGSLGGGSLGGGSLGGGSLGGGSLGGGSLGGGSLGGGSLGGGSLGGGSLGGGSLGGGSLGGGSLGGGTLGG